MLKIIPAIDLRGGKCVRLQQGDYDRQTVYDASPIDMAKTWEAAGASLIHIVDLDGARAGQPQHLELIAGITAAISTPCELGGGIRKPEDVHACLEAGVARVILGTVLVENPDLATRLIAELDPDKLVAGLDARDGLIAVNAWQRESSVNAVELASRLTAKGFRNIIYTDIATDGMFTGPNLTAVEQLCRAVPDARVIASGGIGSAGHVRALAALGLPNLAGVIVGKALYDRRVSYAELLDASLSPSAF